MGRSSHLCNRFSAHLQPKAGFPSKQGQSKTSAEECEMNNEAVLKVFHLGRCQFLLFMWEFFLSEETASPWIVLQLDVTAAWWKPLISVCYLWYTATNLRIQQVIDCCFFPVFFWWFCWKLYKVGILLKSTRIFAPRGWGVKLFISLIWPSPAENWPLLGSGGRAPKAEDTVRSTSLITKISLEGRHVQRDTFHWRRSGSIFFSCNKTQKEWTCSQKKVRREWIWAGKDRRSHQMIGLAVPRKGPEPVSLCMLYCQVSA